MKTKTENSIEKSKKQIDIYFSKTITINAYYCFSIKFKKDSSNKYLNLEKSDYIRKLIIDIKHTHYNSKIKQHKRIRITTDNKESDCSNTLIIKQKFTEKKSLNFKTKGKQLCSSRVL
ncbi:hypothetical protein ACK8HY_13870 [Sphingobacterium sp. NGMCC 1.201703]|uniref:hypothetical protein n=1 Tax=Sphingobacterium sp. NGMCC 1.201703 TaxID=3388657 RepID=UPI0039FB8E13